jgi:hypothetical protein
MGLVFLFAMLSACATSRPPAAPIVKQTTVTRTICPIELKLALPAKPQPSPGAIIQGNEAGLGFVSDLGGYADDLAARLSDAAAGCPQ